jgi:Animal haem peroxidase
MAKDVGKNFGHGALRGSGIPRTSSNFQGKFGRMFRSLPPAVFDDDDLVMLAGSGVLDNPGVGPAVRMNSDPEVERVNGVPKKDAKGKFIPAPAPESTVDGEENFGIPAGYTYLGQFIDHDITFDPASSMQQRNDPEALVDFRTPALDLDCIYGRGPDDQPYMFEEGGLRFVLGTPITKGGDASKAFDLPRSFPSKGAKRAIIGDKRNDENVIVSQLQGVFLQFHNKVADTLIAENPKVTFEEIQREVRWHYQWVVLYDFLPRMVTDDVYKNVLGHIPKKLDVGSGVGVGNVTTKANTLTHKPELQFFAWRNDPFMPIEFSAAAYRFGHSMVRPIYRMNRKLNSGRSDGKGRLAIFAGQNGLNGFDTYEAGLGIDWDLYFEFGNAKLGQPATGPNRIQPSYKIDPSIVSPLATLPEFAVMKDGELVPAQRANLALRNLRRGNAMELPSGQAVARAMGLVALTDDELQVGKAAVGEDNPSIAEFIKFRKDKGEVSSFEGGVPLWFYILSESLHQWKQDAKAHKKTNKAATKDELNALPVCLGPVGGTIVMEVLVGLLLGDSHSFINQVPCWTPRFAKNGRFSMADLIDKAGLGPA